MEKRERERERERRARGGASTREKRLAHPLSFPFFPPVILYSSSLLAPILPRPVAAGALVAAVNTAASAAAAATSDALGRRRALVLSYGAMAVCLAALAAAVAAPPSTASGALSLAALVLYVAAFALGAGPVTWLYIGEVTSVGRVAGAAASSSWVGAALVAASWPAVAASVGVGGGYAAYAVLNVIAAVWVSRRVVESAGRPLEEVRAAVAAGGR